MKSYYTQQGLIDVLTKPDVYGPMVFPQNLFSEWAHHQPIFMRLPGKAVSNGWATRALREAAEGHKVFVLAPSHMETIAVQKLIRRADWTLFLDRRLNVDAWSEGALLAGFNIGSHERLGEFGTVMSVAYGWREVP